MIELQDRAASHPAAADPGNRPEEERQGWPDGGDNRRGRMSCVILRAATVLLDMLTWWPEAVVAGQVCLAALEVRQGGCRE